MKRKRQNNSYSVLIIFIIFILLLCYVWQHNASIQLGYSIAKEKKEREKLLTLHKELKLKVVSQKSPHSIKRILSQQHLLLEVPGERDVIIIKK